MTGPRPRELSLLLLLLSAAMELRGVSARYLDLLNPERQQCRGCVSKPGNIPCTEKRMAFHCPNIDVDRDKFVSASVNLSISKTKVDKAWRLLVKWTVPYDYSYHVLTGYELSVHMLPGGYTRIPFSYCFNFNISTEHLKSVPDVHNTTFEFDCLQYTGRDRLTVDFMLFPFPKPPDRSTFIRRRFVIEARDGSMLQLPGSKSFPIEVHSGEKRVLAWKPNMSVSCVNGSLEVRFTNPYPNASYYAVKLHSWRMEARTNLSGPHQKKHFNITPDQNYSVRTMPMDAEGRQMLAVWSGTRAISCAAPLPMTDALTTTPTPVSNGSHSNPERDGLILMICILILVLVLLLILSIIIMRRCRRGDRRSCWNLGHANPTLADEKVAVFPLYAADDEVCASVVRQHMKLLGRFGNVDIAPYEQLSPGPPGPPGPHLQEWLEQQLKSKLLLFYCSRSLTPGGPLLQTGTATLHSSLLEQAMAKVKALSIRNGVIVNLEQAPVSAGSLALLRDWKVVQVASAGGDGGVVLEDLQPLLSELHGGHPPLATMAGWASSPEAAELRACLRLLWDAPVATGLNQQQRQQPFQDGRYGSPAHTGEQIHMNGMVAGSNPSGSPDSPLHQPSASRPSRFGGSGYNSVGKHGHHGWEGKGGGSSSSSSGSSRNGRGPNRRKGHHASRPSANEGQGLLPPSCNRAALQPPPRPVPDVESDTDAFISPTDVESISGSEGDIMASLRRFNV